MNFDAQNNEMPMDPKTGELSDAVKGRTIDISSDGKQCAVGFKNGTFRIYRTDNWDLLLNKKVSAKLI